LTKDPNYWLIILNLQIPSHQKISRIWENGTPLDIYNEINAWWKSNNDQGKTSVILCYSLGKAQRIIKNLDQNNGDIIVHEAIADTNDVIKNEGINLPEYKKYDASMLKSSLKNSSNNVTEGFEYLIGNIAINFLNKVIFKVFIEYHTKINLMTE
jgi:Cft2 family RNA processing exonuclease